MYDFLLPVCGEIKITNYLRDSETVQAVLHHYETLTGNRIR